MSTTVPVTRDSRRRELDASPGQKVFTFDAPIWDIADLYVAQRLASEATYVAVTAGISIAVASDKKSATVTFAAAPRPLIGDPALKVLLEGRRIHERATDATLSGAIRTASLEAEFDKISTVLQELRRDANDGAPASQAAAAEAKVWSITAQGYATTAAGYVPVVQGLANQAATSAAAAAASAASIDPALFLTKASNLAGLADYAAARTNLGLVIGAGAGQVMTWGAGGKYPAVDGSQITGVVAASLVAGATVAANPAADDSSSKVPSTAWARTQTRRDLNATDGAPMYACRAWVNFNGVGGAAIRASGNVSSVVRNAAGDYTMNFSNALQDANYAVVAIMGDISSGGAVPKILAGSATTAPTLMSASAVRVVNGGYDAYTFCISVFR